ncbi:MAG: hypothetical protein EG823_07910 [Actinobacteria bacterium]|nr:hypothetical protein [Actinomycetota bacterium]
MRRKAAKSLLWAVPYAVLPPAIAFWIGSAGGIADSGTRSVVVVLLMVFWIAGFFAMIGIVWDLAHPVSEARARIKGAQPRPAPVPAARAVGGVRASGPEGEPTTDSTPEW